MPRNSFISITKLPNVRGRISYITSHARQENLYAVYETTDRSFWTQLAKCSQTEFKKSGTEGKCIEARELIIALPEAFVSYNPNQLLKVFTEYFKNHYGTDCVAALHHNKRKTNYHIHLIFSERTLLDSPTEKVASRNMFYDENGKHVRTKKEILDGEGNIRKGCTVIKKGEVYERQIFSVKDACFKADTFLDEVKQNYTNLINQFVRDEKQKLQVFERGGMYLATKKIGKNNPKAEEIKAHNKKRVMWNQTVDRAVVTGIARDEILQVKKRHITERIALSEKAYGNRPDKFSSIIGAAIAILEFLISKIFLKESEAMEKPAVRESEHKLQKPDYREYKIKSEQQGTSEQPMQEKMQKPEPKELQKPKIPPKHTIPPRPKMPPEATLYHRLCDIDEKLKAQNRSIFEAERQRGGLEIELSECKSIFKSKRRSELAKQISDMDGRISNMKARLSCIAREYRFQNVEEFYKAFKKSKAAFKSYQIEFQEWKQQYVEKPLSLHDRLKEKEREIQDRQTERPYRQSKDRGAR